jgi:hypothetical protein
MHRTLTFVTSIYGAHDSLPMNDPTQSSSTIVVNILQLLKHEKLLKLVKKNEMGERNGRESLLSLRELSKQICFKLKSF